MSRFDLPPSLGVVPYAQEHNLFDIESGSQVIPYTTLFREDTDLGVTLGTAADFGGTDELFRVISAGCSYGPEIDTVLALAHKNMPGQKVAILGVDFNERALAAAQDAGYHLFSSYRGTKLTYSGEGYDFDETMRAHGIDVEPETDLQVAAVHTENLRRNHDVVFRQADLSLEVPTQKLANLVLCHNVLFHHSPEVADVMVTNMAGRLAARGVLSFGANPAQRQMDGNQGMDYMEWCAQTTERLEAQGVNRLYSENPFLIAFQRGQ